MPVSLSLQISPSPVRLDAWSRTIKAVGAESATSGTQTRLYFDTARGALVKRGFSLWLQSHGHGSGQRAWTQCLQADPAALQRTDSLDCRPYPGRFDFAELPDSALAQRLDKWQRKGALLRVAEARLSLSSWTLPAEQDGAPITLSMERGTLSAGEQRVRITCLRLSHPGDDPAPLFALAQRLAQTLPLLPALPVAEPWGNFGGSLGGMAPVKAGIPALTDTDDAAVAFRRVALDCLHHAQANREGAMTRGHDPEYVHQLRVAIRRLRAALQIFSAVLPADLVEAAKPPLRELMASLGRTRDLDVLMHEIVAPVQKALPDEPRLAQLNARLAERLEAARADAAHVLLQPHLCQSLLGLTARLEALSNNPPGEVLGLHAFADQRLRKRLKAVRRCAAAARADDPVSLHELRIAIKRLRYGLEFFSSLLPAGVAAKTLKKLATLQEELGQLNDLASAGALLMASAGDEAPLREAVTLIGGWHGTRYAALLADIPTHLKTVEKLRLPHLSNVSVPVQTDVGDDAPLVETAPAPESVLVL